MEQLLKGSEEMRSSPDLILRGVRRNRARKF